MLGRVRQRKNHRALVDPRHALDDLLREGAANRADADDRGRLDALDGRDEIPGRRVLVRIRLLEVDEVLAGRFQQAVDVEHIDPCLGLLERHALRHQRGTEQVGEADTGRTRAEEQVFLVLQLRALELGRIDHAGKYDAGRALHVVVIDAVLVAVALEQVHGVATRPILEVNAALREHLLHRLDELVDKRIKFRGRRARLAHAQIQRIVQVLLVVGARVEVHGQQVLRRHAGAGGVELQLADGDARAVCAKVAQAEDAAAVGDADEPNVFLRPVLQNLLHLAAARDRKIHAARLAVDVAELQAGLADGRVVHDRQKARRVRHDGPVEERFVVIEQIDEIDVAIEVGVLVAELHHHATQLQVLGLRDVGHEADEAERLLFGFGEGGRLVERWIPKQLRFRVWR